MDLREALQHACDGDAVLFLGAGYSCPAINASGQHFPAGGQLRDRLGTEIGVGSIASLDVAAEMFIESQGEVGLIKYLKEIFTIGNIQPEQMAFAAAPWRRIYTTNYDHIFEASAQTAGLHVRTLTLADAPGDLRANERACFHINGSIEKLDHSTLRSTFMLTDVSYLSDNFNNSRWSHFFREDVEVARAVIFVGYSLYDLDIARVLYAIPRIRDKTCFVVASDAPRDLLLRLNKFGSVYNIGVTDAGTLLTNIKLAHTPKISAPEFHSFIKRTYENSGRITSGAVFNLFVKGELDLNLLPASFSDPRSQYYLPRLDVDALVAEVQNAGQITVIHSYLGNGKTFVAQGVLFLLSQRGWAAYELDYERRDADREYDLLRRTSEPTIVLIEDYYKHFGAVEKLLIQPNPNLRLLLTVRTPTHLTTRERLIQVSSGGAIREVAVDRLSEQEVTTLDRSFEVSGLLGEHAKLSKRRRLDKMTNDCNGELREILLWIMEDSLVKERLATEFARLDGKPELKRLVIAAMALQHIKAPSRIQIIAELCGIQKFNQVVLSRDPVISEFLRIDQRNIVGHSPLFATYALRALWSTAGAQDILVDLLESALRLRSDDSAYGEISRELMRYSNINWLVPQKEHDNNIISYYEDIRALSGCTNNPFFWLQYAIVRLSIQDYPKAKVYLDTAYGLARDRPWFKTFQLDTTWARYLIEKHIFGDDTSSSFNDFRAAHKILSGQMKEGSHGYYPFRVAGKYGEFWDRVASHWPEGQQRLFQAACAVVLKGTKTVASDLSEHADIVRCRVEIARILR